MTLTLIAPITIFHELKWKNPRSNNRDSKKYDNNHKLHLQSIFIRGQQSLLIFQSSPKRLNDDEENVLFLHCWGAAKYYSYSVMTLNYRIR